MIDLVWIENALDDNGINGAVNGEDGESIERVGGVVYQGESLGW